MQKLVFFISQNDRDNELSSNIGNLYMNRFIIDEDAGHEIVKFYEIKGPYFKNVFSVEKLGFSVKERIGMGYIIFFYYF